MRKLLHVGIALFAGLALGAGVALQPSTRYEFTNCAVAGSVPQSVKGGVYNFRVTDADTRICINATANPDAGTVCGFSDGGVAGEMYPLGTVMNLAIPGGFSSTQYVSCSSSTATGDMHLTYAP